LISLRGTALAGRSAHLAAQGFASIHPDDTVHLFGYRMVAVRDYVRVSRDGDRTTLGSAVVGDALWANNLT